MNTWNTNDSENATSLKILYIRGAYNDTCFSETVSVW